MHIHERAPYARCECSNKVSLKEDVYVSYRTDEAGVVPGVAQSFDELIASFHWEVAAMTLCAKECDVI